MNIYDATEQAYKNGKKEGEKNLAELEAELKELKSEKAKAEGLQRCVDCIHHNACKQWADHLHGVVDIHNSFTRTALGDKAKGVSHIDFPMVQDPKYPIMCLNFCPVE